jgi:polar amino acid transport system substrate-binding protein
MQAEDGWLTELPELLDTSDYAYILPKDRHGEALAAELNGFLRAYRTVGTMKALQEKWFDSKDLTAVEMMEYSGLPAVKGTIRLATIQYPPFVFSVDDQYSGYEIELLAMFCREKGYGLEITELTPDGVLAAVQSGKCDAGCAGISVTEERKESMLFSEPDYSGGTTLVVMKEVLAPEGGGGFWPSVADSFQKTFIREDRWKLFLSGIGTTLLISVASVLFGTALGFLAFLLCRKGNPVANTITRFSVWLVRGMPAVVLLMILYYVIFGNVSISGTLVAIIGFTLVFAAGVFSMLQSGVGAVDPGQMEAAYALGYSDRRAFFRVVLPQALPHFMPAYTGSITELIKATAIVGYVAVQDLTKMGDIVRSRTYEAFFPLIAVAVIYFILAGVLTAVVRRIGDRMDPRRRNRERILEGLELE